MGTNPQFETWNVGESPISIEYSLVVLEEIRHEVNQGLQKFSRGGVDVGGILYGTRDGRKIRVTALRMIQCGHLHGPAFILSDEDQAGLRGQLAEDASDPHLQDVICLGWFLSHNRGEMALTDTDVTLFTQYFRDPWQVTLVIRPGRAGSMKAGFFVWEQDGTVRADSSYKEFNLPDRLASVPLTGMRDRTAGDTRGAFRNLPAIAVPSRPEARSAEPLMPAFDASQYVPMPAPTQSRRWPIMSAGAVVALALLGFGWNYLSTPTVLPSLGLEMVERDGQLRVEWDPLAGPIALAATGKLNISDGGEVQAVPLSTKDLASGKFVYVRKSGDVEVRMSVADANGRQVEEASRFLGRPPQAPKNEEFEALQEKTRQLEAEIAKLRGENAGQAKRIQELEAMRLILQSRVGIK